MLFRTATFPVHNTIEQLIAGEVLMDARGPVMDKIFTKYLWPRTPDNLRITIFNRRPAE